MLFCELRPVLLSCETLNIRVFKKVANTFEVVETAKLNFMKDSKAYNMFFRMHPDYVVSDVFSTKYGLSIYLDEPEEPKEEMPEISNIRKMFDDFMQEFEECGVGGLL